MCLLCTGEWDIQLIISPVTLQDLVKAIQGLVLKEVNIDTMLVNGSNTNTSQSIKVNVRWSVFQSNFLVPPAMQEEVLLGIDSLIQLGFRLVR